MNKKYTLGIIGHPIGHTLSPVMHRTAARHNGIAIDYEPFDVTPEDLAGFMDRLRSGSIDGLSVTVPHKVAVMEFLDGLTQEAERIGAVNTLFRSGSRIEGDNTDGYGFLTAITHHAGEDVRNKKIFVYGAGGAARAVLTSLAMSGGPARLTIANRTRPKAEALAARLAESPVSIEPIGYDDINKLVDSIRAADIIVNTTTVGMDGIAEQRLPGADRISNRQLVVDIVYRPLVTPLLEQAAAAGAKTLDGLWMLIHQGAKSFERWTGKPFPVAGVREALIRELGDHER